jgi:hypothetical protein
MNEKSSEVKDKHKKAIQGIVTARKCGCCGHHEMGITTESGIYIAFKPGMLVKIVGEDSE